jgi:hypothetical protein
VNRARLTGADLPTSSQFFRFRISLRIGVFSGDFRNHESESAEDREARVNRVSVPI